MIKFKLHLNLTFILVLTLLLFSKSGNGQTETDTSLCIGHKDFIPDLIIGEGTPYTHASLMPVQNVTNIFVNGDFIIDTYFTFENQNLMMSKDVTIVVEDDKSLTLRNSNLFGCDELWRGIKLAGDCGFNSYDSSIEDATIAVKSRRSPNINIVRTVFNRNRVGIRLIGSYFSGPSIEVFSGNHFTCTSPITGTEDEITKIGMDLRNVDLILGEAGILPAQLSFFEGIEKGIVVSGKDSKLVVKRSRFENIMYDGIKMQFGDLTISDVGFKNFGSNGILLEEAQNLRVFGANFEIDRPDPNHGIRSGIRVNDFLENANIDLQNIIQEYNLLFGLTVNTIYGIYLLDDGIEDNARIKIWKVNSNLFAKNESACIYLKGSYAPNSEVSIRKNNFKCGSALTIYDMDTPALGVFSEGEKSNMDISVNNFSSYANTFGVILGIYMKDSEGLNNRFTSNAFVGLTGVFMKLEEFKNSLLCMNVSRSNLESGFTNNIGFEFVGDNSGTSFTNNAMYSMGVGVKISQNGIIGPQIHNGNKWLSSQGSSPSINSILCDGCDIVANRFEVSGGQSIFNTSTGSYSFFNPYYPINLSPEEIMISTPGTPPTSCIYQLVSQEGEEDLNLFADGLESSKEVELNAENLELLRVFPNPTTGNFELEIPPSGVKEISITNLTGYELYKIEVHGETKFYHALGQGIYLVSFKMMDGQIETQKLVVQ